MQPTTAGTRLAAELAGRLGTLTTLLRRSVRTGVSPTVATVLSTLERDGAKRVSDLADVAQVAQPTMTTLLRKLSEDGRVQRGTDANDQRVVTIAITDGGRDLLARIRSARQAALDVRLASLAPDERAALAAAIPALDTLLENWRETGQS
ncbi:MAG: MarR family transcriptional regulator [Actinocatenispora sp.]